MISRRRTIAGASPIKLRTVDGVTLRGIHLPANPQPDASTRNDTSRTGTDSLRHTAFVISHGMTNAIAKSASRGIFDSFGRHGGVIAVDFRGHGRSGGRSTVGRDEIHDVSAAVACARDLGYQKVVAVGFSMGGAVTLRYAGLCSASDRPAAVVSVSAPSRWYIRSSPSMKRVHWLLESPFGTIAGRAVGIRLAKPWPEIPQTPLEVVNRIAPTPLLIIHGTADHYFSSQEAQDLHRAAPGSELWLEPGMGHAETGIGADLIDRIAEWVTAKVGTAADQS